MADVVTTAYAVIFIGILLAVGAVIFGTVADPVSDQFHSWETVIAAGCSDDNGSTTTTLCTGTLDNIPIENGTRVAPIVYNCTGASCVTLTDGTHYNFSDSSGLVTIITDILGDVVNGTIKASYWEDDWKDSVDLAHQSITGTAYGGFDLATVMVIVMAAVAIVSTIVLIGKRGA